MFALQLPLAILGAAASGSTVRCLFARSITAEITRLSRNYAREDFEINIQFNLQSISNQKFQKDFKNTVTSIASVEYISVIPFGIVGAERTVTEDARSRMVVAKEWGRFVDSFISHFLYFIVHVEPLTQDIGNWTVSRNLLKISCISSPQILKVELRQKCGKIQKIYIQNWMYQSNLPYSILQIDNNTWRYIAQFEERRTRHRRNCPKANLSGPDAFPFFCEEKNGEGPDEEFRFQDDNVIPIENSRIDRITLILITGDMNYLEKNNQFVEMIGSEYQKQKLYFLKSVVVRYFSSSNATRFEPFGPPTEAEPSRIKNHQTPRGTLPGTLIDCWHFLGSKEHGLIIQSSFNAFSINFKSANLISFGEDKEQREGKIFMYVHVLHANGVLAPERRLDGASLIERSNERRCLAEKLIGERTATRVCERAARGPPRNDAERIGRKKTRWRKGCFMEQLVPVSNACSNLEGPWSENSTVPPSSGRETLDDGHKECISRRVHKVHALYARYYTRSAPCIGRNTCFNLRVISSACVQVPMQVPIPAPMENGNNQFVASLSQSDTIFQDEISSSDFLAETTSVQASRNLVNSKKRCPPRTLRTSSSGPGALTVRWHEPASDNERREHGKVFPVFERLSSFLKQNLNRRFNEIAIKRRKHGSGFGIVFQNWTKEKFIKFEIAHAGSFAGSNPERIGEEESSGTTNVEEMFSKYILARKECLYLVDTEDGVLSLDSAYASQRRYATETTPPSRFLDFETIFDREARENRRESRRHYIGQVPPPFTPTLYSTANRGEYSTRSEFKDVEDKLKDLVVSMSDEFDITNANDNFHSQFQNVQFFTLDSLISIHLIITEPKCFSAKRTRGRGGTLIKDVIFIDKSMSGFFRLNASENELSTFIEGRHINYTRLVYLVALKIANCQAKNTPMVGYVFKSCLRAIILDFSEAEIKGSKNRTKTTTRTNVSDIRHNCVYIVIFTLKKTESLSSDTSPFRRDSSMSFGKYSVRREVRNGTVHWQDFKSGKNEQKTNQKLGPRCNFNIYIYTQILEKYQSVCGIFLHLVPGKNLTALKNKTKTVPTITTKKHGQTAYELDKDRKKKKKKKKKKKEKKKK
ncbi:hypothetical protein WN51_10384 [Melipona quadrifasciata]|uniref:Uncharacterized protein n=1 Tax=Melipona quadrifasciata TaxID=166423 RepID=A0A0M9A4C8_9HYME|nr:hypothetical protein WN51_10384 [Melipona quadrifasciata]